MNIDAIRQHGFLARRKLSDAQSRVLQLALPAVGEQILNMMVGIVNTFLVGHLGAAALAGVGLGSQISFLATTFFTAIATGTTALVARHIGARDPAVANRVMHQSLLLGAALGLLASLLCFAGARSAMVLLGAQSDVVELGSTYLRIVALTMTASAVMFVGNATLRGSGDTRTPMKIMGVVNGVNMLAAYTLVNGLGPFPALGVTGSALGAALGHACGGLLVIAILSRGRRVVRLRLAGLRADAVQLRRIVNVGLPAGLEMLAMRLGMTFFAALVASLGTAAYAAHQVVLASESLSFMPGFGFGVAAATLMGQGLGAGDARRAEEDATTAVRLAMLLMSCMGVLFFVLPGPFMRFFTSDPEVIANGIGPLRMIALAQPSLALMMVLSGALRGAGDTRGPLLVTTLGIWCVRLPLGFFLVRTTGLGLVAAWLTMIIDLTIRGLFFLVRFRSGRWRSIRL